MEKNKKNVGKIIALVVSLVVIVTAALLIIFLPKNQIPKAVMELNVNPNVQFLLDSNNKVMAVNYLNDDAQTLLKDTNFNGKSAEQAAQLFVKLSTEAGFIEISTSGTRVDVTISCETPEELTQLKDKIIENVNSYFDENGIIAGAVVSITENVDEAIQKIGIQAKDTLNKTKKELLELYNETSKDLKDVALCFQNELMTFIQDLKDNAFSDMVALEERIDNLMEQIENSNIADEIKKELQKQLDTIKTEYNKRVEEFNNFVQEKIDELKEKSKEIYNQARKQLQQHKQNCKKLIEQHKEYFKNHKEAVQDAINAYRESLVA